MGDNLVSFTAVDYFLDDTLSKALRATWDQVPFGISNDRYIFYVSFAFCMALGLTCTLHSYFA